MGDSQEFPSSPSPLLSALEAATIPVIEEPTIDESLSPTDTLNPPLPIINDLRVKSKTFPPSTMNKNAHLFLRMVTADVKALPSNTQLPTNLSQAQVASLERLKTYTHLTIKQADKGRSTVVLENDHYEQLCLDILENRSWYKPIPIDQADKFLIDFYSLVDEAYDKVTFNNRLWQFICTPIPEH